ELAAARAAILSPRQILERISQRLDLLKGGRDSDPRQQTLRATIEWSHDLLSAGEQRLFARLAVFRAGCTLEAAGAVCDAEIDLLQSLVAKSLLRHRDERFWMLETIREFAFEQLVESGEAEPIKQGHAEHYASLVEAADKNGGRGVTEAELARIDHEMDNCRAALAWAEERGDRDLLQRLANALANYWIMRGLLSEGRSWLELALQDRSEAEPAFLSRMLGYAAHIAEHQGEYDLARGYGEESLKISRQSGDAVELIGSLNSLAGVVAAEGD